jgi:alkylation response protein AidB-like acyl-CoA dehydrogenase
VQWAGAVNSYITRFVGCSRPAARSGGTALEADTRLHDRVLNVGAFQLRDTTDTNESASERVAFGRAIGQNQGVQFPIASAHIRIEAADLMRVRAAELFDRNEPCAAEANMAKYLAADASWEAANVAVQTFGGYGFAVDSDIERKFRETRLYQVAPVSTNLILSYVAEHVLGLPRSY